MQGHDMVRAVRETGRIVQVGVQQRGMARTFWNANGGYLTPVPP